MSALDDNYYIFDSFVNFTPEEHARSNKNLAALKARLGKKVDLAWKDGNGPIDFTNKKGANDDSDS